VIFILKCSLSDGHQGFNGEPFQRDHKAAGEKSVVEGKGRVFRRGAKKDDGALFHIGEKSILLGFVEAVDFVEEEGGRGGGSAVASASFFESGTNIFEGGGDGGEMEQGELKLSSKKASQTGFPGAGGTPENGGTEAASLEQSGQGRLGVKDGVLAEDLVRGAGAESLGQGDGHGAVGIFLNERKREGRRRRWLGRIEGARGFAGFGRIPEQVIHREREEC
jgi:hypothetical protein